MENDYSSLIFKIMGSCSSKSAIYGVVKDIRNLLNTMQNYKVSKINRLRNQVAHYLAKFCRSAVRENVPPESAPPCVASLINHECNDISSPDI